MATTMKAIVKAERAPGLKSTTKPIPEIGPQDVLVRVKAASICGTDIHIWEWNDWAQGRIHPPITAGHEIYGEVVNRGAMVTKPEIGDLVALESHVVCNHCNYCRTGNGHICKHTRIIGVDRDGGFAEFISIPAQNAWAVPRDMPLEVAVLYENFGNAVHTAFATGVSAKTILVTGCGPVGAMCIAVVRTIGAHTIYAADISEYRLQLARKMGADLAINAREEDIVDVIRDATGGEGVDILLEMSGAPDAITQGFTLLKPGGEAVILGLSPGPFLFDMNSYIVFKAIKVHGVAGRRLWETWYQADKLLRTKAVDLSPIVTHQFDLEDYEAAFETMSSGQSGKIVLVP